MQIRWLPGNPLKSEADAFGCLVRCVIVIAAIVALVLIVRAL